MPSSAAFTASCSGEKAPCFREKKERVSRCTKEGEDMDAPSIPEPLHMPAVVQPVEVQIPHRAAAGLYAPVLPVPTVFPPPSLYPPSTDHVDHLVSASPPLEHRGHP